MRVAFIMSLVAGILSMSGLNATTCCKPSHGLPAAIDRRPVAVIRADDARYVAV